LNIAGTLVAMTVITMFLTWRSHGVIVAGGRLTGADRG